MAHGHGRTAGEYPGNCWLADALSGRNDFTWDSKKPRWLIAPWRTQRSRTARRDEGRPKAGRVEKSNRCPHALMSWDTAGARLKDATAPSHRLTTGITTNKPRERCRFRTTNQPLPRRQPGPPPWRARDARPWKRWRPLRAMEPAGFCCLVAGRASVRPLEWPEAGRAGAPG